MQKSIFVFFKNPCNSCSLIVIIFLVRISKAVISFMKFG